MDFIKQDNGRDRLRTLACAFFLPVILMLTAFAASGIYPFGEKTLLIIDMNSEYIDYLAGMNLALRSGGSFLRSWNMGMGLNMLGLIAFYTASPFNLLMLLLPVEVITEAVLAATLLKLGTAGLMFALYTGYTAERRGLFAVIFSTAYALCAYNVVYASNIMWLDGAAFLPLVLLGAEKLLRENRKGLLLAGLAYVFFTSYYIGYMVGLFALLYMTAVWFSVPRKNTLKGYLKALLGLAGTAALAAGLCAFLLLPAFLGLLNGQSEMWRAAAPFTLDKSLVRMASRLLPGVYDTPTDAGYPNIYCTLPGLLLCIVFFTHKGVPRREKLVFGGLMAFLLVSFSCGFLDLAWHAFEDPTWYPARYSFVFSFFVLFLAMRAALRLDSLPAVGAAGALGVLALLITEVGVGRYRYVGKWSLISAAALAAVYALLWLLRRGRLRGWTATAALLLACAEIWVNTLVIERGLDRQFAYKPREEYTAYREELAPAVTAAGGGAYRVETTGQRSANGGMALGYKGISHYSTTTDQGLNAFLRKLGYNKGTENELRFAPVTPLTGGFLGVRYVLSEQDMGEGYRLLGSYGRIGVYENEHVFPLAFWAERGAAEASVEGGDPFALQNELFAAVVGEENLFKPLNGVRVELVNADREEGQGFIRYSPRVKGEPAEIRFHIANTSGGEAYAYFPVWQSRFAATDILVNEEFTQRDLRYRGNTVVQLGAGEEVVVTLRLDGQTAYVAGEYFYALDIDRALAASGRARLRGMEFERFDDTIVSGRIDAPEDSVLVTSFPLDSGWRVYIDGERTQVKSFAGVFMAVDIPEGSSRIEMRYRPPGFLPGCAVSGACAAGLALWQIRRRVGRHQAKGSNII